MSHGELARGRTSSAAVRAACARAVRCASAQNDRNAACRRFAAHLGNRGSVRRRRAGLRLDAECTQGRRSAPDPRFALHSATVDPVDGAEAQWPGEAKIAGKALAAGRITDGPEGDRFRVDVTEVVHTHLNEQASLLVVEWWTPRAAYAGSSASDSGWSSVALRRRMAAMTARAKQYDEALAAAHRAAEGWLSAVPTRQVPPRHDVDQVAANLPRELPEDGANPSDVVDELDRIVEPGLMSIGSGRFFGWVMGATLPAALAADWLVSTWDQNAGLRAATPGVVATEEVAARWLLDLLHLPAESAVGFVTGATTANFSCLAAARHRVLADVGWDVSADGLCGAPQVRVVVGQQRHDSVDAALRYLGLGAPTVVPADAQGRIDVRALEDLRGDAPTIVCLQAGNLHSGAFDDFAAAIAVAKRCRAWVHIDGAFGLWAAASPHLAPLMAGAAQADSWATDAHKTLNVPYDCGIAVVKDASSIRAALGIAGAYLLSDAAGDPLDRVPEMSRRARGVPVWAALRSLGRTGVADLVDRLAAAAAQIGEGLAKIDGVEILNEVVYTQVCFAVGSAERTDAVIEYLRRDGVTWMSGSCWAGRRVIRVSVSNWSIDADDIAASVDAVVRAVAATG